MKHFIFSITLLFSVLHGQIDTLEYLSYFPLHIGNRWQYEINADYSGFDTTYFKTITVLNDTLMPNGKTYYPLYGFFEPDPFFRIDTSSLQVLHYYPYNWDWLDTICVDSEIVIFNLNPIDGNQEYLTTCGGYDVLLEAGIFQIDLLPDPIEYLSYSWFDGIEHYYILSKGIGVYYKWVWELFGTTGRLVAAEINGVRYGEFVSVQNEHNSPQHFVLYPNYPNPFNASTTIRFDLPEASEVKLVIYDILGQKVETLVIDRMPSGTHKVLWDANNVSTGIYFVRMVSGGPSSLRPGR